MNGLRARVDYLIKHFGFVQKAYKLLGGAAFRTLGLFTGFDENLALFSAHGRGYNDSPRALYQAMRKDERFKHIRCVWALEDPSQGPGDCEVVKPDTPAYFRTALRARYWITCVNIERGLTFKKKKTTYLNTWHGTPLKTIGNAAGGRKDYDFSHIDLFCSAGDYESQIYIRDFGVDPKAIFLTGLPRNDALYHAGPREVLEVRQRLGVQEGKRVVLYAPTWRDSQDGGVTYGIKPPVDMEKWKKQLGPDTLILVRAHAYTNKLMGIQFDDQVWDMTAYPSVNDLMLAADVLVSDYSAILFDYSILGRPMICFGYDYEQYAKERGLYLDLNQALPGGVLKSEDQVLDRILHMDVEEEEKKTREFCARFLQAGGSATQMCLQALLEGKK